ncbi:OmpA family protein [Arcicella aurantiaca]|uniref:OmpA family protein n=1 Tax=Arcicella aurantiaca TaxID=591202 RepID=A0A316EH43_9BACT|nr:OmpA family protein [Arcicella aurantiaca]PWK29394.1 OmpA family protein [Arcicella aurantiaca]
MNLFGELKELLLGDVANKASNLLGEKEDKVKTAIEGLIPTFVGGLMKRASNEAGATTLMNVVKKGNHDGSIIEQIGNLVNNKDNFAQVVEKGNGLVSMLLPDKKSSIATMISQFAGVRNSSATSLLSIVAPIVVGKLGKMVATQNLDKAGLANTLLDQRSILLDETPENLQTKMIDVLGLSTFLSEEIKPVQFAPGGIKSNGIPTPPVNKPTEHREVTYSNKDYDSEEGSGMSIPKWLLPTILIAAVLGGIGYFAANYDWSSLSSSKVEPDSAQLEQVTNAKIDTTNLTKDSAAVKVDSSAAAVTVPTTTAVGISLPNGQKVDLTEGSFNFKFAKYLTDSSAKANQSFTFDNLNFESNTNTLVAGSEKTVQDLAKIMSAYPRVQVKLIGYTDNTGDSLQNRKLSFKRAFAVKNLLVANGVQDLRIDFAGKGALNPIASNATEEGKAKNRRIEMKVVKK